jgi:carboxylesterase type B
MTRVAAAAIGAACLTLAMTDSARKPVKTESGLVSGTAGRDRQIAATLSSYWANFAATGNPNGKGLAAWPAVTKDAPQTMEVGDEFRRIPIAATPARIEFYLRVLPGLAAGAVR